MSIRVRSHQTKDGYKGWRINHGDIYKVGSEDEINHFHLNFTAQNSDTQLHLSIRKPGKSLSMRVKEKELFGELPTSHSCRLHSIVIGIFLSPTINFYTPEKLTSVSFVMERDSKDKGTLIVSEIRRATVSWILAIAAPRIGYLAALLLTIYSQQPVDSLSLSPTRTGPISGSDECLFYLSHFVQLHP